MKLRRKVKRNYRDGNIKGIDKNRELKKKRLKGGSLRRILRITGLLPQHVSVTLY